MVICLSILIICVTILGYIGLRILNKYVDSNIELRDREIKNKKHELFDNIDIEKTIQIIDDFIENYINRYAVNKFIANNVMYIRPQDQEEMNRNVTKNISADISELYIYYISLIVSIESDDDLIKYIYNRVKNSVISFVADYNKARIDTTR